MRSGFRAAQSRPSDSRCRALGAGSAPRGSEGGLGGAWRLRRKRARLWSVMGPSPSSYWVPSSRSLWRTFCEWAGGISPALSGRGLLLPPRRRGAEAAVRDGGYRGLEEGVREAAFLGRWGLAGRHCCLGYEPQGLSAQCRLPGAGRPSPEVMAAVGRAASACSLSLGCVAAKQRRRADCRRCSWRSGGRPWDPLGWSVCGLGTCFFSCSILGIPLFLDVFGPAEVTGPFSYGSIRALKIYTIIVNESCVWCLLNPQGQLNILIKGSYTFSSTSTWYIILCCH